MAKGLPLVRAHKHKWGEGQVHLIDETRDTTKCGRSSANCPGDKFWGILEEVTCKGCLKSIEADNRAAAWQAEYERKAAQRRRLDAYWHQRYAAYLASPTWQRKRALVLERAGGYCEGCGQPARLQVHHLQYPHDCSPGSPEWVAKEKLFDLVAVCRACHEDIHLKPRSPYAPFEVRHG